MPLPYFDTAGSASYVLEQKDRSIAAVASLQAAKVNKLTVLKSAIEDNEHNFTRFLVIVPRSKKTVKPKSTDRFKTSLLFALKKNLPGGLFKALTVFAMRDIDLLKIESRPIPGKPWEYIFYLDLAGSVHNIAVEKAIGHLEEVSEFVKVLGSYPPA
jgi:prephenate dehydratase